MLSESADKNTATKNALKHLENAYNAVEEMTKYINSSDLELIKSNILCMRSTIRIINESE